MVEIGFDLILRNIKIQVFLAACVHRQKNLFVILQVGLFEKILLVPTVKFTYV